MRARNVMAFDPKSNPNRRGLHILAQKAYLTAKCYAKPVFIEFVTKVLGIASWGAHFRLILRISK